MSSFGADLAAYAKKIDRTLDQTHRAVVIELFSSTILDTPVDEGTLRANWNFSVGSPNEAVDTTKKDKAKTKQSSKTAGSVTSAKIPLGGDVFLTNAMPYAYRIEYEGWSHTKAPAGMMRKNLTRVQQIVAAAAQGAKS